jgi:hypothetical protein
MPNHNLNDSYLPSFNIYFNSDEAEVSYSDAEKLFFLKNIINVEENIRILIGLNSLTIPNTVYNIQSYNNSITIDSTEYTITPNNYDSDTLTTELNSVLPISVSFDDNSNKFTFSDTSAFIINSATMAEVLGLSDDLPTASASSFTASHVINLSGVTNIHLKLNNITLNNLTGRGVSSPILASVVNNSNFSDYVFYQPNEIIYHMINATKISYFDFTLTDQNDRVLELNGSKYNFTLTIHFIYEREAIYNNKLIET